MGRRKRIPENIQTNVLVFSRRRCALCYGLNGNQDEMRGQIAHIDKKSSNNSMENLIYLCLNHHDMYDSQTSQSKGYTEAELKHYRKRLYELHQGNSGKLKEKRVASTFSPLDSIDKELIKDLYNDVYKLVFGGFVPNDQIVNEVIEMYKTEYDGAIIKPYVVSQTDQLLQKHRNQQKKWPLVTDCDKLDEAFQELESRGVLCRQDFADCLSCGYSEIWSEVEKEQKKGRQIKGFTFFHQQDTEFALEDNELYLGFGAIVEGEKADLDIANEIVRVIRRHRLKVKWNNKIEKRIGVIVDWKRRRT